MRTSSVYRHADFSPQEPRTAPRAWSFRGRPTFSRSCGLKSACRGRFVAGEHVRADEGTTYEPDRGRSPAAAPPEDAATGDRSLGDATHTPLVILDNDRPGSRDETFNVSLPPGFRLQLSSPPVTAVQPDGRILVGAYVYADSDPNHFSPLRRILVRLQPDGSWDPSLNVQFDVERGDSVKAMAVQPDGKIVACIIGIGTEGFFYGYLARLNVDGSLDPSFDPGFGQQFERVPSITRQPDGQVLVAHDDFYGWSEPQLVRLNGGPLVDWQPKVELLLPWTNGQARIGFNTLQGRRYDILASSRLTNWTVISSNWSTGSRIEFTDINAPGLTNRFYRVRHFSP